MSTPIHITFDSNVWRPLVSPSVFPSDPDAPHFEAIRNAIQKQLAFGFLSETTFTLEPIQKNFRKAFFGSYRADFKTTVKNDKAGVKLSIAIGPSLSQHASNNPVLERHLRDALVLSLKLLRCPRIGGVNNADLLPSYYAADSRVPVGERQERCGQISREIETRGWGIKHLKEIGNKYANGKTWLMEMVSMLDAPRIKGQIPSFELIESLQKDFATTLTATAVQFVLNSKEECAIVASSSRQRSWFILSPGFSFHMQSDPYIHGCSCAAEVGPGKKSSRSSKVEADYWLDGYRGQHKAYITEDARYFSVLNRCLSLLWIHDAI